MFGWFRLTAILASSSNMARNSGACASPGWIFLSTSSFDRLPASGSRARKTSAIPPAPSRRTSSNLPKDSMRRLRLGQRGDDEVIEVQLGLPVVDGEEA